MAIDCQGSGGLEIIFQVGAYTDGSVTPLIEESDDNVTYTAVADADLLGTEALASFTFAGDDKCYKIGYKGSKRYVTCTITPANNTGAALLCVIAITVPQILPTSNPPA